MMGLFFFFFFAAELPASGEKWSDCRYILKIIVNKISCSVRGGDEKKRGLSTWKNEIIIF